MSTYAVIKTSGTQMKIVEGETVRLNRLSGEPGAEVVLPDVLLVATDGAIEVGKPTVAGAKVVAEILKHARGKKIRVYKYKKKKGYQRTVGHRSEFTFVKVKSIARG